jgi:transcriptional regulator with XRE-family HTH domain
VEQTARELLRAIRGRMSQVAFSRLLGYASNIAADWESGRRSPTIEETLRAAARRRIDVPAAFATFHARSAPALDPARMSAWLVAVRGSASNREIADRTGWSEHRIGRWMRGASRPRLPQFLALVDALTHRCSDLVAALVPIAEVPSLAAVHGARARMRRLAFELPWTPAILTQVGVLQPHADPGPLVARSLGVDPDTVTLVLRLLEEAGVVAVLPEGMRVVSPLTVDTQASDDDLRALREHWSDVARNRLRAPLPTDRFAYNVFNVSLSDLERIHALQAATFHEIRAIVAASHPRETSALLLTHLLAWPIER